MQNYRIRRQWSALVALAVLLPVSVAVAQSFNIDIDAPTAGPALGGGTPSDLFGAAANLPGQWNSFPGSGPTALAGLNGAPSGAAIAITATSTSNAILAFNNPGNTGDFALLLNDGSQIGTTAQGGTRTYSITGLADGPYEVFTYTARPSATIGELFIDVAGSSQGELVAAGLAAGNTFTPGVSHVVHTLNLGGGTMVINLRDGLGAPAGYVDGFQLRMIPETGAAALAMMALVGLRRRV